MRQRISHGADIDTATPAEVAGIVAAAFERKRPSEYHRSKGIINLTAAGAGTTQGQDVIVPPQYDMLLERVTIGGGGAPSALICIYENHDSSDADLLEVIQMGTVGKYSDSFSNCVYITAHSAIRITVTGGVANLQITYNLQARLIPST